MTDNIQTSEDALLQCFLSEKIALNPAILHQEDEGKILLTTSEADDCGAFYISGLFVDLFQVIVLSEGVSLESLPKVIASFPREKYQSLTPSPDFRAAFITFFNFLLKEKFLISDYKARKN